MRNWFLGASLVLMVACSGAENTANLPKDSLRISNSTLSNAIVNESYNAPLGVLGGVAPYIVTLVDGKLPAGVTLTNTSPINLSGTPTEKGNFNFTVQVTDANLSTKVQKYTLVVTDKPPPDLSLQLPGTPVKSATRIPVVLNNAENVAGGRFTMTLPEGLTVKSVQPATGKPLVVWFVKSNLLTVDFAFTQKFFRNKNALFLEVESNKEAGVYVPSISSSNYDLRDGNAKKLAGADLVTPPAPPTPKPAETPKAGETPASGTTPSTSTPAGSTENQAPAGDPVDPDAQPATPTGPQNPAPGDNPEGEPTGSENMGGGSSTERENVTPPATTPTPPQTELPDENRPTQPTPPSDSSNEGR
ncbi:Ig domain-containing protein [Deinococcus cellulosilyticus]|uniref:Uncharacterized protein n=1 Tax=Deinococcus cellulosilyticus (strain DSM 18568 / NBRC 106333 / KACC 11606 / 5516J-15) TaxID=1223518 RepID=A0A511N520_DEIC1|nr:Ig domain-containing protein [Deinococcus cellulosilyticus]GEM47940.1 hypothetical protein DC3_35750 [Deinococcus cellulosilyticus NBRC 106333 = KACC 11606]